MKVSFKPEVTTPVAELQHGEYSRRFERAGEPFTLSDKMEEQVVLGSGLFESVEEPIANPHE